MIRLLTYVTAYSLLLAASLVAEEKNIRFTIQTFSLSQESLTELISNTDGKDPDIHKETVALTSHGKAKLLDTVMITSRWGELATAQSFQEYIYPTEFDPQGLQVCGDSTNGDGFYNGTRQQGGLPSCLKPTAFETRLLGTDLGVSSHYEGNVVMTSQLEIAFDELVRLDSHFKHKDNWGKMDLKMPVFDSWRSDPKVPFIMQSSTFTLYATHRPSAAKATTFKDSRVLIFVRADVITP